MVLAASKLANGSRPYFSAPCSERASEARSAGNVSITIEQAVAQPELKETLPRGTYRKLRFNCPTVLSMRYFEQLPNASDQRGNGVRGGDAVLVREPGSAAFGAPRRRIGDIVARQILGGLHHEYRRT